MTLLNQSSLLEFCSQYLIELDMKRCYCHVALKRVRQINPYPMFSPFEIHINSLLKWGTIMSVFISIHIIQYLIQKLVELSKKWRFILLTNFSILETAVKNAKTLWKFISSRLATEIRLQFISTLLMITSDEMRPISFSLLLPTPAQMDVSLSPTLDSHLNLAGI